jgi:excinuclease UvrABC nuclease subunit
MTKIVTEYARMWPREVFYQLGASSNGKGKKGKDVLSFKGLGLVNEPGVYVLYRDGVPYYVGKATKLRQRLWAHACSPAARYHNFWNHFSAFVVKTPALRNQVEAILIAAMPTANGAKPRIKRAPVPEVVTRMSRAIYEHQANPGLEFKKIADRLKKMERLLKASKGKRAAA